MRIAHVLRRLSFDDWGGTEQVVWNIAKAQKAAGHEVRLFATTALCRAAGSRVPRDRGRASLPYVEVVDGLEILRFKPIYPWWPMPRRLVEELDRKGGNPFVPGLGKAIREWKPDVIHCHAMARIAELCLRTAQQLTTANSQLSTPNSQLPTKTVISLHGGGANVPGVEAKSLMAPTRGRLPWGKMVDYALGWTRRVPEDFGGIVCVGEDEAERYRAKHPHVMYLPNGVDTSLFTSPLTTNSHPPPETRHPRPETRDPLTANSQLSTLNSQLSILCVARIDRQKNQMMLVEWLSRNPGATLRLVGPVTQADYREELESRAAALGVGDRVTFVGALRPGSPELVNEYLDADVFVLPSRHEPFGIVVLEAWAAGLPVVASDVGGLGRLCAAHPDAAVVFPAGDAAGLDRALAEIARRASSGELAAMKEAGRRAAAQYDWRALSARIVDFYAEI